MNGLGSMLSRLWSNWITLAGALLTTASALAIVAVLSGSVASAESNPYIASFLLLGLPAFFVGGLLLIPIGLFVEGRRRPPVDANAPNPLRDGFAWAFKDKSTRLRLGVIAGFTLINVLLFAAAGQGSVHYADSAKFCGTTCHTVMQPEWEAYNRSPHSRVACVQCHIGPGASWAVKSKINGLKQVLGVMTGNYHRPVPTPVEHLRPSRDTCEQCHWPQKFTGNRLKLFPHYEPDENNTPSFNLMLLHIGGEDRSTGKMVGIHTHVAQDTEIRYQPLDKQRKRIGRIVVLKNGKVEREYLPKEEAKADSGDAKAGAGAAKAEAGEPIPERTMDCVDCHNRPTHWMDQSAKGAVDRAIYTGQLDRKVPFIAQASTAALQSAGLTRQGAESQLRQALQAIYQKEHEGKVPAPEVLDSTAKALSALYLQNVYPDMKVGFGTYPTNLGHKSLVEGESAGCFRCHDGEHAYLKEGKKKSLSQSCELCHEPLAQDEDPAKFEEAVKQLVSTK
jgi:NapC/NirT cytochrome c family, N-terminal region